MEDKNIQKYNELEGDYFSSCSNWDYEWKIGGATHYLTWDFEFNVYNYFIEKSFKNSFKNIYEALDKIIIEGKTLKQLLLETDFDFYSIY